MKTIIITAAVTLFLCIAGFAQNNFYPALAEFNRIPAQDLTFEVHGRYDRPVNKVLLEEAEVISDFVDGYPSNWINKYESVEILATNNGKTVRALSTNDKLTKEQKNILKTADLASDIVININYESVNTMPNPDKAKSVNSLMRLMHIKMTVIPEIQAEYAGGQIQMSAYLKESVINKIPKAIAKKIDLGQVIFTINEEGKIENAKLSKTSGDLNTDKLIVDAIAKMPGWKPAENSKGIKVKQDFKFSIGMFGC